MVHLAELEGLDGVFYAVYSALARLVDKPGFALFLGPLHDGLELLYGLVLRPPRLHLLLGDYPLLYILRKRLAEGGGPLLGASEY